MSIETLEATQKRTAVEEAPAKIKEPTEEELEELKYIRGEDGQIVGGFLTSTGEGWEKNLPQGVTKDMVYIIPESQGFQWRLRYGYITSQETINKFSAEELDWSISQPEENVYDPRKK